MRLRIKGHVYYEKSDLRSMLRYIDIDGKQKPLPESAEIGFVDDIVVVRLKVDSSIVDQVSSDSEAPGLQSKIIARQTLEKHDRQALLDALHRFEPDSRVCDVALSVYRDVAIAGYPVDNKELRYFTGRVSDGVAKKVKRLLLNARAIERTFSTKIDSTRRKAGVGRFDGRTQYWIITDQYISDGVDDEG